MRCLHVCIHGMVQGVGYRFACQRQAEQLGILGWVRNRHDGSVEALVAGNDPALRAMQAWFEQGPALARVDRVTVEETTARPEELSGFSVLPTP
ncbi:MAG TPA: acylphosphatase [Mariprofundaceae bacterium]|nr:acylphosphatase [Mariprofundaceae bacterium]